MPSSPRRGTSRLYRIARSFDPRCATPQAHGTQRMRRRGSACSGRAQGLLSSQ